VRTVIGEDELLLREGLARLLCEGGFDVVAQAADAADLVRKVHGHRPALVVTDVRMPPMNTDDGLRAALEIRRRFPETAVVALSHQPGRRRRVPAQGTRC
jgi:DNA-binding NarL/FixJ family response regulator